MKDADIELRTNRVEEIIEILEEEDVSIERAKELREEAESLLDELERDLDVGEGEVEIVNE